MQQIQRWTIYNGYILKTNSWLSCFVLHSTMLTQLVLANLFIHYNYPEYPLLSSVLAWHSQQITLCGSERPIKRTIERISRSIALEIYLRQIFLRWNKKQTIPKIPRGHFNMLEIEHFYHLLWLFFAKESKSLTLYQT